MELSHIYNPGTQTADQIIESFVIRKKEFKELMSDVKRDKMTHPPQHYIIQGQRGTGKTTLLLRLYHEIKRDEKLNKWMIPVIFSEEQYNVRTLYKLWEEFANYLSKENEIFAGIEFAIEDIKYNDLNDYEEKIYELLISKIKASKKKVTLFIDNIGLLFVKFSKKDQQRLREILLTDNNFRIVGASAYVLESIQDYVKPFYEFFKVINLNPLLLEDTKTLLLTLDEKYKSGTIPQIIKNQPGRIEALRRITGGIPRTIVLLFEIFSDRENGNSLIDLEVILDKVTPLYKHRMDDLPAQQQEIAHIIAMNWDAITTGEIAKKAKMESKTISAQLRLMVTNGLITKIPSTTKNHLYQVSERFFNIWYLMRFGARKERERVKWLVKFLEVWCTPEDLVNRAERHLKFIGAKTCKMHDKYAFYFSEALVDAGLPEDMQHNLLNKTREYLEKVNSPLIYELSRSDLDIKKEFSKKLQDKQNLEQVLPDLIEVRNKNEEDFLMIIYTYENILKNYNEADHYLEKLYEYLVLNYDKRKKLIKKVKNTIPLSVMEKADALISIAIEDDNTCLKVIKYIDKVEGYFNGFNKKQKIPNDISNDLYNGVLNHLMLERYEIAEKYYLKGINEKGNKSSFFLASLYEDDLKDFKKLGYLYKDMLNLEDTKSFSLLAKDFENTHKNYELAEKFYLMAIANEDTEALNQIAYLYYSKLDKPEKAIEYYQKAIEHGNHKAMNDLGVIYLEKYKDYEMAEKYFLMAIEKGDYKAMNNLGQTYMYEDKDIKKAEKYLKMAVIEGYTQAMLNLANLYEEEFKDYTKAEKYYQMAIEKNNENGANNLVWMYYKNNKTKAKALKISKNELSNSEDIYHIHTFIIILLWNNEFQDAKKKAEELFKNSDIYDQIKDFSLLLEMFMAKGQFHFLQKVFKENKFEIKDRFKAHYYALMRFMKDDFPNEHLKMGSELKQTVEEIIEKVKDLEKKYK